MTKLIVLFGQGGLSDVGRHAVIAALEASCSVLVLTQHPELLEESDWNCGCPEPHSFTDEERENIDVIKVNDWADESLQKHFEGAEAVVSCVGNRQPTFMGVTPDSWCSYEANQMVIKAMKANNIHRAVVMSSMGVEEDWPPMEFNWAGKIMSLFFLTCVKKAYKDLTNSERAYRKSDLDYLLVRPVGIGEDTLPVNKWKIQMEKYKDKDIGTDIAKLDVARFMVQEALNPTIHEDAVVLGSHKEGA